MRDIRSFVPAAFFVLLLTACLSCVTPWVAHAATLPDNQNGETCTKIAAGDTIQNNYGTIDLNSGEIINNYSVVRVNNGIIENNFSVNTYTDERIGKDGGSGTITYNYFVDELLFGKSKNNFFRIERSNYPGLDWSLNPANFTTPLYLYIGASSNIDESQRGATFKASEGYRITLKSTNNTDFKVTDNGDETFTITVTNPDYRKAEISLNDAINVEKLISVSVSATPAEGGSIVYAGTNEAFVSGNYSYNTSFSLEAKANEGYRFVGWVGVPEQEGISAEGNKLAIDTYRNHEWENVQTISCIAEFEKIPGSNNVSKTPGSDSTEHKSDKSSASDSVLPPTGDVTFITVALISIAAIAASALSFATFRKRA